MSTVVTSYVNPDLDGVASAIVVAEYLASDAAARFEGRLAPETTGVLGALGFDAVASHFFEDPAPTARVVLVDCHHPAQLPAFVRLEMVIRVVDHHSDGRPESFPNADIQNELVGAAATLVAEHLEALGSPIFHMVSPSHAALLACAIASNTLDFTAPSTTLRDKRMFEALRASALDIELPKLLQSMGEWRAEILRGSTHDVVAHDVKVIESTLGLVAISQFEADGARGLLERTDLREVVDGLASEHDTEISLLSLVDTAAGTTILCTTNPQLRQLLMVLDPVQLDTFILELPYIALRKTHIIPALQC